MDRKRLGVSGCIWQPPIHLTWCRGIGHCFFVGNFSRTLKACWLLKHFPFFHVFLITWRHGKKFPNHPNGFHRERFDHPTVHVLEVNLPEILAMKVLYKPWRCSPPICSRELRNLPRNPRVTWPIAGWTSTPANTTM